MSPTLCCHSMQIYKRHLNCISLYLCIFFFPLPSFRIALSFFSCSDFLLLSASLVLLPSLCLSLCQPPPTWTRRANERPTSNRHGNSMWMCSARGVGRSVCRNCTRRLSWTYRVCCKVRESAAGASSVCFCATRGCVARSSACLDLHIICLCFVFLGVHFASPCMHAVCEYPPLLFPFCFSQCM